MPEKGSEQKVAKAAKGNALSFDSFVGFCSSFVSLLFFLFLLYFSASRSYDSKHIERALVDYVLHN